MFFLCNPIEPERDDEPSSENWQAGLFIYSLFVTCLAIASTVTLFSIAFEHDREVDEKYILETEDQIPGWFLVGTSCHEGKSDAENPQHNVWGFHIWPKAVLSAKPFQRTDCPEMKRIGVRWIVYVKLESK